jgi:P2-related tail formation protein
MRKNIAKVIDAFKRRVDAKGDSKGTCSTDGESIFSYRTEIARRLPNGLVWVTSYAGSQTTKMQVSAIVQSFGAYNHFTGWWGYDRIINQGSSLEDFKRNVCGHGADEEEPTRDHCWGNAELMRECCKAHAERERARVNEEHAARVVRRRAEGAKKAAATRAARKAAAQEGAAP